MKTWKKIMLIFVFIMILGYIIFVLVDCRRLQHSKADIPPEFWIDEVEEGVVYEKPLICIRETREDNSIICTGLGYSVKYTCFFETEVKKDGIRYTVDWGTGGECYWFGIRIWEWNRDC